MIQTGGICFHRRLARIRARHDALTVERDVRVAEAAQLASDLASLGKVQDGTLQALDAQRQRAERSEAECARLEAECREQRQRAEQTATQLDTLQRRHDLMQGSLRTFLRCYLPLLRRHLFGQRP